jgi:hypothetical protein
MNIKHAIDHPTLDVRLLLWKIGEELDLPYIFREDLVALSVKLGLEYTFGAVSDKSSSNALVTAYALVIFYLKLHYGLVDSTLSNKENENYVKSGFPTQLQLLEVWKSWLKQVTSPQDYTLSGFALDFDFYKRNVVAPRTESGDEMEADLAQIKRSLRLDAYLNTEEIRGKGPFWLKFDLDREIEITDKWARQYPCSLSKFDDAGRKLSTWSEAYRILLELGARFCCCEQVHIESVLTHLFETNVASLWLHSTFQL